MRNQQRTPKMREGSPKRWRARVETRKQLILKPSLASSRTWLRKCPSSNIRKWTHLQVAIRPGRGRQETNQEATGTIQKMCRAMCSKSNSVQILNFVHSTKNITSKNLVRTGSELQTLYAVIISIWKTVCRSSRKKLIMTKRLHPMNHQVLGMWWTRISASKKCRRRTLRSSSKSKMTDTISGVKGFPLHLGKHKKIWDYWWGRLIHQPPQRIKHKKSLGRHRWTKVHPWVASSRTLSRTTQTSVLRWTPRWVYHLWNTTL